MWTLVYVTFENCWNAHFGRGETIPESQSLSLECWHREYPATCPWNIKTVTWVLPGCWGGVWETQWRSLWDGFSSTGRTWVGIARAQIGSASSAPNWLGALPWSYPCSLSLHQGDFPFIRKREERASKRAKERQGHRDRQKTGSTTLVKCGKETQLRGRPGVTVNGSVCRAGLTPWVTGASFGYVRPFPSGEFLNSLSLNLIFLFRGWIIIQLACLFPSM